MSALPPRADIASVFMSTRPNYQHNDDTAVLIPLAEIRVPEAARDRLKIAMIAARMATGKSFDPILVTADGVCVDGKHRLEAARTLNHTHPPVVYKVVSAEIFGRSNFVKTRKKR